MIISPADGAVLSIGSPVSITGTASDAEAGSVVSVELSFDHGASYIQASGTTAWSFNWTPSAPEPTTIMSRAWDNAGNMQNPPSEIAVTVRIPIIIKVPSDQPTIQSAINAAAIGDTVLVAPGFYSENINFEGKAITVMSESGPDGTMIDGGGADSVISFISGEGRGSILNGFTLQNGAADQGGGIKLQNASPVIMNNMIKNNKASAHGGGIYAVSDSNPLIVQNLIIFNQAFIGAGLYWISSAPMLINNTIAENNALNFASGIYADGAPAGQALMNNIIMAKIGQSCLYCIGANIETVRSNNLFSNGGSAYAGTCSDRTGMDGNISAHPRFNDPIHGDYHLQQESPSIDAGDNQALTLLDKDLDRSLRVQDGDGNGSPIIDMGVYEFLLGSPLRFTLIFIRR